MFGTVRTVWALMVLFGHLFWVSDFGRFAVFGFYILSGYLMTYIMHQSYGYSHSGSSRFMINRFLRLYPTYWIACLVTLVLLLILGEESVRQFAKPMSFPQTLMEGLQNFTMLFMHWIPNQVYPRLSPATWALTVELFFYLMIALGASKTLGRVYIWLALSIAYVIASYALGLYWHSRYFSIPAGSLPFAIGAWIYFICQKQPKLENPQPLIWQHPLVVLVIMMLVAGLTSHWISLGLPIMATEIIFYLNILISAYLVYLLARGYAISSKLSTTLDRKIGDYSYPIYVLHWQAGALVSLLTTGQVISLKGQMDLLTLATTGGLMLIFCLFVIKTVDTRMEPIRARIR